MKKRLFLTGQKGCGKSTAIARALGDAACRGGGFFTRRQRDEAGNFLGFTLESPDGLRRQMFLEFSQGKRVWHPAVFTGLARELLSDQKAPFLILDEIGGVELQCPEFMQALQDVFARGVPCIGVMKGPGPSGDLVNALGLDEDYLKAARELRSFLSHDPDTLLYTCGQFDEQALALARQWVQEYAP